jgi:hypothetical protein
MANFHNRNLLIAELPTVYHTAGVLAMVWIYHLEKLRNIRKVIIFMKFREYHLNIHEFYDNIQSDGAVS